MSARRTGCWILRLAAWAVLIVFAARIALQPAQVHINGRICQLHLFPDARWAGPALFREFGLDRHLQPDRYQILNWSAAGAPAPAWLGLRDLRPPPGTPWQATETWLCVEGDGRCRLPPVAYPVRDVGQWMTIPQRCVLPLAGGNSRVAFVGDVGDYSGIHELLVWIHKSDHWVNVLRCTTTAGLLDPEWHAGVLRIGGLPNASFRWDPLREVFLYPDSLPPGLQALDLLPDQTWETFNARR